jgi:hypothetical protein
MFILIEVIVSFLVILVCTFSNGYKTDSSSKLDVQLLWVDMKRT